MRPPDTYHHPRPNTVIDILILPLAGISGPLVTSFGHVVDNTIVLLHFLEIDHLPRDRRRWRVSAALHTFCPILLRRITP